MLRNRLSLIPAALLLLLLTVAAHAARPQSWTFASQKDFAEGRFENLVVNSYGELSLGRPLTPIPLEHAGENVSAFAQTPDGALYVATSPDAVIFRLDNHKATQVFKAPKGFDDITAMTADAKGNLLVALSGESARLLSINPATPDAAPITRFQNADASYIWSIAQSPDGTLYLGTGPHGKIFRLAPNADPALYLDTTQKNITALTFDKAGNLVAGSDAHGLVFRIDASSKKAFVLLDAGKVDINALATDPAGNLYVATAKTELADSLGNVPSLDDLDSKGKPSTSEAEPMDPPQEEGTKAGAFAPLPFSPILGAVATDMPADLKALLKKAAENAKQDSKPSKPHPDTLPAHRSKQKHPKPMHVEEPDEQSEGTSAVLRISPDGLATTLVQDQGNNYSLLLSHDQLLIGTGDEGKLFAYSLTDQSLSLISRVKEQQISTLFAAKDATLFVGTGNMAQVYEMPKSPASTGTFTSQVLDATHHADFGHALADTTTADGSKVTIATRTGNTQDIHANAAFWSDWADLGDASKVLSPAARYLQVRITLTANSQNASPTLSNLRLAYQTQNLPPRLRKVTIELPGASPSEETADPDMPQSSDDPNADKLAHVAWDAGDPNGDSLVARLYYKPLTPDPKEPWTLFARDQKDTPYDWDTKTLPDGKYQVKVVVSDSPDNPADHALEAARTSSTITIDHTPPVLSDLTASIDSNKATLTGSAKDALSPVTDVRYQVDGQNNAEDWQPAAASDKIFDSPQEAFTIVTRPLSAGTHRITIRATDASGNSSYKAVTITVKS